MGQKSALGDTNGNIIAYYDDKDSPAPTSATNLANITDTEWQDSIANQRKYQVISGLFKLAPLPTTAQLLTAAQTMQIDTIKAAYANAIVQPISYTSKGGVTKTYQADPQSVYNLQAMLAAYSGVVPTGFYWVAADNTQVPFAFSDLQGLAAVIGAQGWTAFQHLQTLKAQILAATTIASVQGSVW